LRPRIAVALALLCWLPLHVIAVETAEIPAAAGRYSAVNADGPAKFAHFVTDVLQYLMPGMLLTGALVVSLERRRRAAAHNRAQARTVPVGAMRQEDFYGRLEAAFRARGHEVLVLEGAPPGTADLVVADGASRFLVQRSHWQSWQVGDAVVRELAAEVGAHQVDGGYVITGGWFSREARELAVECGVELIDGDALGAWIGDLPDAKSPQRRVAPAPAAASGPPPVGRTPVAHAAVTRVATPAAAAPACPKCGASMQRRQATRGKMQGQFYWACSDQPRCLGILPCRAEPDGTRYGAALTH
jgi:restriction system protein